MSNIPIVQGVAVPSDGVGGGGTAGKYRHRDASYHATGPDGDPSSAQVIVALSPDDLQRLRQDPIRRYQDVPWALLYVAHLVAVLAVIGINLSGGGGVRGGASSGIVVAVAVTGLSAVGFSTAALAFMMRNAETLVQTALIFSVCTSLAVGVAGFMIGSVMMGVIGLVSFAVGLCYAKIVWPRIPFAAANLNTALTAVRVNMGLAAASFGFTALAFVWTVLWFLGLGDALSGSKAGVVFLLFLSYYWVHQVLQNTMHVTTAGVVGTWWFVPSEASSFWSPALSDSLFRSVTYSFGSICFGSLLVAIVQALRALEYYTRDSDDLQFLSCIIQCILACIEGIIEELNRWAYVYVGLYGFSYLEAGRNVVQLFQAKGWTAIITDDLADNVLFMMSVAIGLATGVIGMIMGFMDQNMFAEMGFDHAAGPGFLIGFLTGFLFATIIMSVVASAVNTVIVCYAEDPAAFQMNHPELSAAMRGAWVQAWPGLMS